MNPIPQQRDSRRSAFCPACDLLGLGVKAGWRFLEAGVGGGSFARWLCSAALPGGRVLAVDADPRHLADLPGLGGEVAQLDLVANDIPERASISSTPESSCCTSPTGTSFWSDWPER
nr:hypothetical protein [Nocardia xishanensis]